MDNTFKDSYYRLAKIWLIGLGVSFVIQACSRGTYFTEPEMACYSRQELDMPL